MSAIDRICEECAAANKRLPATGLVDLTFGNVSVLDRDAGLFAIKPSGVPYDELSPANMAVLDLEGNLVRGELRPSSDTPTHRALFRAFGDAGVNAIVHTHARSAVAFAQAQREIPCFGTTHADYFHGPVPLTRAMTTTEIEGDYEWETGAVIVERFAGLDPLDFPSVLVRNHGPFSWGTSADKALEAVIALEVIARMALGTLALNPNAPPIDPALLDRHFLRKHGKGAYYGQP